MVNWANLTQINTKSQRFGKDSLSHKLMVKSPVIKCVDLMTAFCFNQQIIV